MRNTSFIGPITLLWVIILIAGSYYAFFNKMSFESIVLRYGRIFFNFEIWRLFTPFFTIAYPDAHMKLYILILILHLRQYEFHPFQVTHFPNAKCDLIFTVAYSIIGFWFVSLFYPLYYGSFFVIMTLLTIITMKDDEETFDLIGYTIKRCRIPIIYAFIAYIINRRVMGEIFSILWGYLFIQINKETSPFYATVRNIHKKLFLNLLGYKEISYTSAEKIREVYCNQK